jgi:hypothetical protein
MAVRCPPLVPAGPATGVRAGLMRGPDAGAPATVGWAVEAMSPSLGPAARTHGGHWRVERNSPAAYRQFGFRPPPSADAGSGTIAGRAVRYYEMPPYPFGGVDGDHVVVAWSQGGAVFHVSLHGHGAARRAGAVAMAAALMRAADVRGAPLD